MGVGAGVAVGFGFGVGCGFSVGVTNGGGVPGAAGAGPFDATGPTGVVGETLDAETGTATISSHATTTGRRAGRAKRVRALAFKEQRSLGAGRAHAGTRLTSRGSRPREASSMVRASCPPMTCGALPLRGRGAVLRGTAP
jgi:hypothetical protein